MQDYPVCAGELDRQLRPEDFQLHLPETQIVLNPLGPSASLNQASRAEDGPRPPILQYTLG